MESTTAHTAAHTTAHTTAKHVAQEVLKVDVTAHATRAAGRKVCHSKTVVVRTFVVIVEDLVGLGDGFEAVLGVSAVGFGDFVWMGRECCLWLWWGLVGARKTQSVSEI